MYLGVGVQGEGDMIWGARRKAYNEAGHAVAAHACGLRLRMVDAERKETRREFGQPENEALVCLAGPESQRLAGQRLREDECVDDEKKADHAIRLAIEGGQTTEQDYRAHARTQASDLLFKRWAAVEALAAALLEQPALSGEEAEAVIETALGGAGGDDMPVDQ